MKTVRLLSIGIAIVCLWVACGTDIPKLKRYRTRIWNTVEKMDRSQRRITDIANNRANFATYRAIQLAEDIANDVGMIRDELSGMAVPIPMAQAHTKLEEAAAELAKASAELEAYAAAPNDMKAYDRAGMFLRSYAHLRGIAVTRIENVLRSAGLVAHPPESPIPDASKGGSVDGYFHLE